MIPQLSRRLQAIAERIPEGSRLADIGSDHALLPTYLAGRGRISFGIAGEVNRGPYEAAKRQVQQTGVSAKIEVRLGDGLAVLEAGEVDTIVIAGMGGALIARILEEGKSKLDGVERLVLQPNVAEDQVRVWLRNQGWQLLEESILEEDGHIYEILVAERHSTLTNPHTLYTTLTLACGMTIDERILLRMGPWLLQAADEIWMRKWDEEASKLESICQQMEQAGSPAALTRLEEIKQEVKEIREVIACLQTGRA